MDILRFPLVKVTAFFVPGIVVAAVVSPCRTLTIGLWAIAMAITVLTHSLSRKSSKNIYFGLALYLTSFAAGFAVYAIHDWRQSAGHYITRIDDEAAHSARIVIREKLKNTGTSQRYVGVVLQIDHQISDGKILLNIKHSTPKDFGIGHELIVHAPIVRNKKPLNPSQFDYSKYLDRKSIPAQVFLSEKNFLVTGNIRKDIWYYSDLFRNAAIRNLRKSGFGDDELQVLNALILGQQQEISRDLVRSYQLAGAVHILSVSGLHVGFILILVNLILRPVPKTRVWRWLRFAVTVCLLFGYAIIAGLSPSVVRSVVMFSFVACGMCLGRSTNIFHTLVVSIFLILIFEPKFLFEVGFQLSYAALFFIVWLQPWLVGFWTPGNRIVRYLWEILTVSIAAQLGTLPLSLYYFHQFPGLFFLTNLAVIPLLTIIMVLGGSTVALAGFDFTPKILTTILEFSIEILNGIIKWIASKEAFVIKEIPLSLLMLVTLLAVIISVVFWLKKPSVRKLQIALLAIAVFQMVIFADFLFEAKSNELIVFNIPKRTLIAEKTGRNIIAFGSLEGKYNPIEAYSIDHFGTVTNGADTNVLFFGNKKILIIDSTAILPNRIMPDMILLRDSPKINLDRLVNNCKPSIIVADASNFKSYVERWKATCLKEKIPFHYTNEKGFYRLKND